MRTRSSLLGVLLVALFALAAAESLTEEDLAQNAAPPQVRKPQMESGLVELTEFTLMEFLAEGDAFWTACAITDRSCGATRALIEAASRFLEAQKGTEQELPVKLGFLDTSLYDLPYDFDELPAPERPPLVPLLQYRDGSYYAQTAVNLGSSPHALLDFIFFHHSRNITVLKSRDELREFVEANELVAHSSLVIFGGEESDQAHRTALSVVQDYPDIYSLASIYDEELGRAELGDDYEEGAVRVYCHFEHKHADHVVPVLTSMANISRKDMTEWLHTWASRHVAMLTPKLLPVMFARFPAVFLAIAPREDAAATELMLQAVNAASKVHTDVGFVFSDVQAASPAFLFDGATGDVFPTAIVMFANPKLKSFAFDETKEFSPASLIAWVDAVKERKAGPFLKSAPVPSYPRRKSGIQEVVFDNFDRVVLGSRERVVVLITASPKHCRECGRLHALVADALPEFTGGAKVVSYDVAENFAGIFDSYTLPEVRIYYKGKYSTYKPKPSLTPKDDLVAFVNKRHKEQSKKRGSRRRDEL